MNDIKIIIRSIIGIKISLTQMNNIPKGVRRDIEYMLDNAHEAADDGDDERILEKLIYAQELLHKLSATVPAAQELATTVGVFVRQLQSLRQEPKTTHNQHISGNAQVGTAVAGNVDGNITTNQPSGDVVQGDKVHGDKVMGDKVINYGTSRPADTNPDHVHVLINDNIRRLRPLEQRAARMGYSTPPEVINEIEDIRAEIARLEALLP